MKWQIIKEGKVFIKVPVQTIPSRKTPIFFNPVMKMNRDISILMLKSWNENNLQIADPLAGSGIRALRFIKELPAKKIKKISINDHSVGFIKSFKVACKNNKVHAKKLSITSEDATIFLLNSVGFDYIDIDPFGSPNPFLDAAIKRLSRRGILAVTATDTSALCGSHENACKRKYWAIPLHSGEMHEVGLRILIRKIQLVAAQYDKALTPIVSYAHEHYCRVFLKTVKGKRAVDEILRNHGMYKNAGPMWLGSLQDDSILTEMCINSNKEIDNNTKSFLKVLSKEVDALGFYDLHRLISEEKISIMPSFESVIQAIERRGFPASRTHFYPYGLKSKIKKEELVKLLHTMSSSPLKS